MTVQTLWRGSVFALVASVVFFAGALLYATTAKAQTTSPSPIPLCEITRGLGTGTTGADVECLQRYLNWAQVALAVNGPGSPGQETPYYGPLTTDAVVRWQNNNSTAVLAPLGLSAGTGYFGPSSFAHYVAVVRLALSVQ